MALKTKVRKYGRGYWVYIPKVVVELKGLEGVELEVVDAPNGILLRKL